ncbi:hypothetical protein EV363DRAFT_1304265 [Boletus edulis]|nr:hypothetical protein EV363DRAFT_1304265 [Boletus edulis]
MAEAKTANMIEWAQGQMIYEMTERVERAEDREGPSMAKRGPKHGRGKEGRHNRVGPGPENVCDYRKDREGPGMVKAKTAEGNRVGPRARESMSYRKDRAGPSMAKARRADIIEFGPGPENVCDYRKDREGPGMVKAKTAEDREGPSMAKRGPKHGRGKEGRHNRVGPGPENVCDYRKDREGPGMLKAKTAEVIEWAQGQRIYEINRKDREGPSMAEARRADIFEWAQGQRIYRMTEMIERAQAWPRQGGPTYSSGPRARESIG